MTAAPQPGPRPEAHHSDTDRPDADQARVEAAIRQATQVLERGDLDGAEALLTEARAAAPRSPELPRLAARLSRARGDRSAAAERLREAVALAPNRADLRYELGQALAAIEDRDGAIRQLEAAVNLYPRLAAPLNALGFQLERSGDPARAEHVFREALAVERNHPEALVNLGNLLQAQGRIEEALPLYQRAARQVPPPPLAFVNMAALYRKLGNPAAAKLAYAAALEHLPEAALVHFNLANLLRSLGEFDAALDHYDRALAVEPENAMFHWNRSLALLAKGSLKAGFEAYEWRWRYDGFPSARRDFPQPPWDGARFEGRTLLLHAEQGMGDTLQFIRYLPMVAERGGRIVLEVQEPLADFFAQLFAGHPSIEAVVPRFTTLPPFELQLPLLSLPRIFGTELATIPAAAYLTAPADLAFELPEAMPDRLNVGLVWAGNPEHRDDGNRSARLTDFAPLVAFPGVRLFSLQKGRGEAELADAGFPILPLGPRLASYGHTAAAILKLDLVISVDTSVAHLAGGLGRPVWILLPSDPDWRWQRDRSDSPWYPSARLFRQSHPGGWTPLLAELGQALTALAATPRRKP